MRVTIYTEPGSEECARVKALLQDIICDWREHESGQPAELVEVAGPEGAPSPCVRLSSPGSPFFCAAGMDKSQLQSRLEEARAKELSTKPTAQSKKPRKPATAPTPETVQARPIKAYLWRHRVGALVSTLSAFLGIAYIAPLLAAWGHPKLYSTISQVYSLVCDQIPQRSASIDGHPPCLCWRCTAIYGGSLFFGIVYTVGRDHDIKWLRFLRRPVSLPIMLLFGLPLILDGFSHALGLRAGIDLATSPDFWLSWRTFSADWWLRILTSLLATVGAVKFMCPRLDRVGSLYEQATKALRARSKEVTAARVQALR